MVDEEVMGFVLAEAEVEVATTTDDDEAAATLIPDIEDVSLEDARTDVEEVEDEVVAAAAAAAEVEAVAVVMAVAVAAAWLVVVVVAAVAAAAEEEEGETLDDMLKRSSRREMGGLWRRIEEGPRKTQTWQGRVSCWRCNLLLLSLSLSSSPLSKPNSSLFTCGLAALQKLVRCSRGRKQNKAPHSTDPPPSKIGDAVSFSRQETVWWLSSSLLMRSFSSSLPCYARGVDRDCYEKKQHRVRMRVVALGGEKDGFGYVTPARLGPEWDELPECG
jgi:hypothetical protein